MKKIILIGSLVVAFLACAITAGIILFNSSMLQEIDAKGETVKIDPGVKTADEINEKVSNFLVLGIADDEGERSDTSLTDVIMLVTMNLEEGSASILQIPRDTYVGDLTPNTKINAVYQNGEEAEYGGLNGLIQYVHDKFQINIDHYVTMKMNNFADIVDALGGVSMNVPDKMSYKGVTVEPGEQVLDGKKALVVVRTRKIYFDGDLGRLDAQKLFLSALAKQCLSADFATMTKLIPVALESVTTDLSLGQALGFYDKMKNMDLSKLAIATAPGTDGMVNGQSIFSIFPNHMAALLNDYFRPYSAPVSGEMLPIATAYEYEPTLEEVPNEVRQFDYLLMTEEEQKAADESASAAAAAASQEESAESAESDSTAEPTE